MKILRYLVGFPVAVIVTSLLFLLMYHLIRGDETILDWAGLEKNSRKTDTVVLPVAKPIEGLPENKEREKLPDAPDEPTPRKTDESDPIDRKIKVDPGPGTGTISVGGSDGGPIIVSPTGFYVLVPVRPIYPASCQMRGVEGEVVVEYDVTNGGEVINAEVVSSTDSCLERSALKAIEGWKYTPLPDAAPDDIRKSDLRQSFVFKLEE